jgi:hypothetical protein
VTSSWAKLRTLHPADRRLLLEAFLWLVVMRIGLALLPYRVLRRLAGDHAPDADNKADLSRLPWAIAAAARRIPGATCLPQALAAQAMLSRRAVPSVLRIGVAGPGAESRIKAHAWVECRGDVIVGKLEDLEQYAVLSSPVTR